MTVCTDVWVRPQTCDLISIYPPQVHPPSGHFPLGGVELKPVVLKRRTDDDDIAIALALLELD